MSGSLEQYQQSEEKFSKALAALNGIRARNSERMASWFPPRQESHEAHVTDIGTLSECAGALFGSRAGWNNSGNSISLSKRSRREWGLRGKVEEVLKGINNYYTHADSSAPIRCSDGRPSDRGEHAPLGPQVFAASVGAAVARHLVEDSTGKTLGEDLRATLSQFADHGITCGGHIDEGGHVKHTGCAGIDRIKLIFDKLASGSHSRKLEALTHTILGPEFARNTEIKHIMKRAEDLRAVEKNYFADGWRKDALKAVEETARTAEHKPVEKLLGKHKEVAFVINTVPGTTFNNTRFSGENKGEIQAFNYDIWEVFAIADQLYPDNEKKRREYIVCRVMLTAATAMILTDGSLRVLVRR